MELTIDALGAEGDGIATLADGGKIFVPLALPGERVRVHRPASGSKAVLDEILTPSPDRVAPVSPHFGACGGCSMQHLALEPYRDWKRGLLVGALAHAGLAADAVGPLVSVPPASRRRATWFARRGADGKVIIGFLARASHDIVDMRECPVLAPPLVALLAPLRDLLGRMLPPGGRAEVIANLLDTGIDLLLRMPGALPPPLRQMLAGFAAQRDLARLSWQAMARPGAAASAWEPIVERRPARVQFGKVAVALPPGAFLQATKQAEDILVGEAVAAVAGAKRVADLFSGAGAFTFPLAAQSQVHAVDGDKMLIAALRRAADAAGIGGRITTDVRDLLKRPLVADELKKFDAVVFDPPRAGASSQAGRIAAARIPVVVAVSCNPASFARDAKLLVDGGYTLEKIVPVDQFLWTAHLELVAVFRRG
jgi:23S rRNA (uracil1939-C5)-methyltransferase